MTEVKTKPEEQQEPLAPEPPKTTRSYRILRPGDRIDRCSYILPNALQCWKAGEELVTETTPSEKKGEADAVYSYQLCERHVRIRRAIDAGMLKKEEIATPLQEMTVNPPEVPKEAEQQETASTKTPQEETGDKTPSKEAENKKPGDWTPTSEKTPEQKASGPFSQEKPQDKK